MIHLFCARESDAEDCVWCALVRERHRALERDALLQWFVDQVGDIRPAHPNVARAIELLNPRPRP